MTDDPFSADLTFLLGCTGRVGAISAAEELIADLSAEGKKVLAAGFDQISTARFQVEFPQLCLISAEEPASAIQTALQQMQPNSPDFGQSLISFRTTRLTPPHYAYLSMTDHCSGCAIPYGRDASLRPSADILNEAEYFTGTGVEELIIINSPSRQNREAEFATLCQELSRLGPWVRFAGLSPSSPIPALLPLMAEGLILPYLDIQFDHVSAAVLESFNHPAAGHDLLTALKNWRAACPGVAVRGSFTVGAPAETEEDFQHLLEWLNVAQLDRVTCHTFAERSADGTPSPISEHRRKALITHQHGISKLRFQTRIGRVLTVLVDEVDEEGAIARSFADAPDIDGCVFLNGETSLQPGQMVEVEIEHADEFDLWARLDE